MNLKYTCGCEEEADELRSTCYKHGKPLTAAASFRALLQSGKVKIESAETDLADEYKEEIAEILQALGIKSAFVSNESSFHDFLWLNKSSEEAKSEEERLSNLLGVKVYLSDLLVTTAAKMRIERKKL